MVSKNDDHEHNFSRLTIIDSERKKKKFTTDLPCSTEINFLASLTRALKKTCNLSERRAVFVGIFGAIQ